MADKINDNEEKWLSVKNIQDIDLVTSMKDSFLSYAMSVIVERALPDARDGLKPVQRRILYDMSELGMTPGSQFKKCARLVGDVMGKFHPHGDSAIYEATVRMAQDFSYRYPLVAPHGNFGSIDGYEAAAMRYTECKMHKITEEMLRDIDKNTVPFVDNYDATEQEPLYLPSAFPNLLANGSVGIAVGMATNIPPHNLNELCDGIDAFIDNPDITSEELMQYVKGPDFPTGGIIVGRSGIIDIYTKGRGSVQVRSKVDIVEMENGKKEIIVREIPYAVNKQSLIKRIADIVKEKPLPGQEKKVDGIVDLRDESSGEDIKIVIECKRDSSPEVILNSLYKYTQLQTSFSAIMLALVDNQPELLTLRRAIEVYYNHQLQVLINKTKFDLDKNTQRKHILEGYIIAVNNIDELIKIIKESYENVEDNVMARFGLSLEQTKAILALPLRRLSGLEFDKIKAELAEIEKNIDYLNHVLESDEEKHNIIKNQMKDMKDKYGDKRRTEIDEYGDADIDNEDLIPREDMIVTITEGGYVKRMKPEEYRAQNRGGRGKTGVKVYDNDVVKKVLFANTHDYLLFFTNLGRVYKLKTYRVPLASRISKGIPVVNLLRIPDGEYLTAMIDIHDFDSNEFLFFVTKNGVCKRTAVSDFQNINKSGIKAITLREGDVLHNVLVTNGSQDIIVGASNGKAIRFNETDARDMGRNAAGVRAIMLEEGESVIGVCVAEREDEQILVITENGYGKRTRVSEYRLQTRGGKGVKTIQVTEKKGNLAKLISVSGDEDLFAITNKGMTIRTHVDQISESGRATQGVKIMNIQAGHKIETITLLPKDEDDMDEFEEVKVEEPVVEAKDASDEVF